LVLNYDGLYSDYSAALHKNIFKNSNIKEKRKTEIYYKTMIIKPAKR